MPSPKLLVFSLLSFILPAQAFAGPPYVSLRYWAPPPVLRETIAGAEFFYLRAAVSWAPDAPQDLNYYRAPLVLPNNSILDAPLYREQGPGLSDGLTFLIPAQSVRNLRPEQILVQASVVDPQGIQISDRVLTAGASDFPALKPPSAARPAPYRWPAPLSPKAGSAQDLPTVSYTGPDGPPFRFIRVFPEDGSVGFFIASTEASMAQINALKQPRVYSDQDRQVGETTITLNAPAYRLTPNDAKAYLSALSQAEGLSIPYRFPTRDEWLRSARASQSTRFWWGDDPRNAAVRFLGNQPPRPDTPTGRPDEVINLPNVTYSTFGYAPNPFGLWHTYGNIAEWATGPDSRFLKMGGTFLTDPANLTEESLALAVDSPDQLQAPGEEDPPQWVGVRPTVTITAEQGAAIIKSRLSEDAALSNALVSYDPDTATATLSGSVASWSAAAAADRLLSAVDQKHPPLWFIASVSNQLSPAQFPPGQLALIENTAGPANLVYQIDRPVYLVPLSVRWADVLSLPGSSWWVNVYGAGGSWLFSHPVPEDQLAGPSPIIVGIDTRALAAAGLPPNAPVEIALSLGADPARQFADPSIVSNRYLLAWKTPPPVGGFSPAP